MKNIILQAAMFLLPLFVFSQKIDTDLLRVKERLDSITEYTADVELEVDISFINMPTKKANVAYKKGEDMRFSSNDFAMLPKRGMDLSLRELFKYPFITVIKEGEEEDDSELKVVYIIPTDGKADFSLATVYLDVRANRIDSAEINTKNDGTYKISMDYEHSNSILPQTVEVSFEVQRMSIPFKFMSKNSEIDRKELKKEGPKKGKIYLYISNYKIVMK
jgi:hypothetical protein